MEPATVSTDHGEVRGFIVGMSRSGTRWLAECLNTHPDVVAIGETSFWGRRYVQPAHDGRYTKAHLELLQRRQRGGNRTTPASLKMSGEKGIFSQVIREHIKKGTAPSPKEIFDQACAEIARVENKRYVVEKTPHHINWMERIVAAYPHAKFVVMVREPYGFMLSYKHQGDRKEGSKFNEIYHPLGCALVYRGYMRSVRRVLSRYGSRMMLVYTHDLSLEPEHTLGGIQAFLGLPVEDILLPPRNTSFPTGKRAQLQADDVFWMNLVAGKEIKMHVDTPLTPTSDNSTSNFIATLRSFFTIPLWGIRTALHMRKMLGSSTFTYLRHWIR